MQSAHHTSAWIWGPIVLTSLLLLLGERRQTQAEVFLTCAQFATNHCNGTPVVETTHVSGGSAFAGCSINVAAGVSLRFKNPENPAPCFTGEGNFRISGGAGSRLRIEQTTIVAEFISIGTSFIHIEDSRLSANIGLGAGFTGNGLLVVEDSVLEGEDVFIRSAGSGEVTFKGADIRAIDNLEISSEGAAIKVKEGSKLAGVNIDIQTAPGTVLVVTGSELTSREEPIRLGVDGGPGDAVDNIKANTFRGAEVTIYCPARVTGNTFNTNILSVTGSSPCICSKNTLTGSPDPIVCPTS